MESISKDCKDKEAAAEVDIQPAKVSTYSFEDVFKLCGDTGRWQIQIFLLGAMAGFPAALQDFLYIYIAATPESYWCEVPQCSSYSYEQLKNWSIPSYYDDGEYHYSSCSRYPFTVRNNSDTLWNDNVEVSCYPDYTIEFNQSFTESCTDYYFDDSVFQSTIVTEWQLVCGKEALTSTSQAVYSAGSLTGSLVMGIVSDNYGRKKAVVMSLMISIILSVAVAFSPTYPIFLVARYCLAIGSPGIYDISYILLLEMIGSDWRGFAGNSLGIPYALGYAATAAGAYFFRRWRDLQLVVTAPALIFLVVLFFVPESPRWLVSRGKTKEAEKILRQMAYTNQRSHKLPDNFTEILRDIPREISEQLSWRQSILRAFTMISDLFRTPKMRRRSILLNICWLSTVLVYFGSALNAPNLSADLFLYTTLSGILEIPSYLVAVPLTNFFGRKFVFSGLLFICGTALGFSLLFEEGTTGILALSLVGKFHVGSAYALLFLYGFELMPTSLRTYGIGLAAIMGKIGSAAAPYIAQLLGNMNKKLPAVVFVVFSLGASLISLLLPETKDKPLPETVEDVENS